MNFSLDTFIHSLSKSEKRYIHLQLQTFAGKDSAMLKDFELLEKNKSKTNQKLTGNPSRLYYRILDILFQFHNESILPDENQFLGRVQVLYTKGFHKEAFKITEKILKLNPHQNQLLKMEVLELRMLNALKISDVTYLKNDFGSDKKKLQSLAKEYFNLLEYKRLWASFRLESSNSYFFGEKDTLKSPLLKNEERALSPMAKVLYNKIKGFVAVKESDYPSANFYAYKAKNLYEEHPYLIKKDPGDYLRTLSNLCLALMFNKLYDEALVLLNDFNSNQIEFSTHKNAEVVTNYYTLRVLLRLVLFITSGKIHDNYHELKELETIFNTLQDRLPLDERLNTYLSFSLFHLHNKDYRKALKHTNFVIKNAEKFRKDIYHLGLMSELTIHYLNENIDLVESKLKSFKRITSASEPPFGFEKEIPHLLGKIIHYPEEKSNFTKLTETINASILKENKEVYRHFITLLLIKYKK